MKINFDLVQVFTDLAKTQCVRQSIRKEFANLIYTQGNGIEAHALALKIYNGDADTEYNEQEVMLIRRFSLLCTPCIIDAFNELLGEKEG